MTDVFETWTRPDAEWEDAECPECGHKFVARDRFGLYCCNSECGWAEDKDISVDPPAPSAGSGITHHLGFMR